ncbi:dUTP diphosphatase [Candidatus Woesearchaeota archaeon]|nr:dUTP diphosphatase [Candidatus Woesearchaeota archaeon]
MVKIKIEQIDKKLPLPKYHTTGSAACDLYSAEQTTIKNHEFKTIKTGIKIAVPKGYEAQIRPRSGLAAKNGISLVNTPGTIDSDYRGEIKIILINFGKEEFKINKGDRIAQLILNKIETVEWQPTENVNETERGQNGFGSTGTK